MIIKASLEHAGILSELGGETFYESHKNSAPAHEIAAYMEKVYSLDAIKVALTDPKNIYHLIRYQDTVAGFSRIALSIGHPAIQLEHVSKMDQIYVQDSFHGLKLGAELMRHNIDYSKSHGENGMWLVVWVGNTTAITFYEKFGFQIVARDQFHLTETHLSPCYIMMLEYAKQENH